MLPTVSLCLTYAISRILLEKLALKKNPVKIYVFYLGFHNYRVAQNVAVDALYRARVCSVQTFRNSEHYAELFDDFEIVVRDNVAVSCPIVCVDVLFFMTASRERGKHDVTMRYAVERGI